MERKLRMGMVGGGRDAFIGGVHRMAARLDGLIDLVAGAFSSDPEKSRASGRDLFLPSRRCYATWEEMIECEAALAAGEGMDFVAIVTPNHLHYPVARLALERGFAVVCDKPMTHNLGEARQLARQVADTGQLFALTHNYTGYPMVKEARHRVLKGELGRVRKVVVEYPQGWLASRIEATGHKQAEWRTDPQRAGASGCMGDIGTHAHNLVRYTTGLEIESLAAELNTFVHGRRLDDDGSVLLRLTGGASGVLHASQVAIDEENGLALRVYGETGGLEWRQEEPNTLVLKWPDRPRQILRTGINYTSLCDAARWSCRLPAGHPEGFIEAFANLYRNFALTLDCRRRGEEPTPEARDFPGVEDGVEGMRFLDAVVHSSQDDGRWVSLGRARMTATAANGGKESP